MNLFGIDHLKRWLPLLCAFFLADNVIGVRFVDASGDVPTRCRHDRLCYVSSSKASDIHFYWDNDKTAAKKLLTVSFKVNGETVAKRAGSSFNSFCYKGLKPGESYQFMVSWKLKPVAGSSVYREPYYIDSYRIHVRVPNHYKPYAYYHIGDQVQDKEGRVYCALHNYQGHGDTKWFKTGALWKQCSLKIRLS